MATAAERKAAQRARQEAQGLSKLEVWAPKRLHQRIKKYVARLLRRCQPRSEVVMARTHKSERLYQAKMKDLHDRIAVLQVAEATEFAVLQAMIDTTCPCCRYCGGIHESIAHNDDERR